MPKNQLEMGELGKRGLTSASPAWNIRSSGELFAEGPKVGPIPDDCAGASRAHPVADPGTYVCSPRQSLSCAATAQCDRRCAVSVASRRTFMVTDPALFVKYDPLWRNQARPIDQWDDHRSCAGTVSSRIGSQGVGKVPPHLSAQDRAIEISR